MKYVLITGANGNLGAAAVREFLDQGYYVIGVDARQNNLPFAVGSDRFELHAIDLTREQAAADFVDELIVKHGRIDAALMLVGGFAQGTIQETGETLLRSQFSLNFETAYFLSRPLLRYMSEAGFGRLVFIGARPALQPAQGKHLAAYSLSKSLLFHLADLINEENTGKNITCTVVVPSTLDTPLNRKNNPAATFSDWVLPQDLASILHFITSEKANALREAVVKVYNNS